MYAFENEPNLAMMIEYFAVSVPGHGLFDKNNQPADPVDRFPNGHGPDTTYTGL